MPRAPVVLRRCAGALRISWAAARPAPAQSARAAALHAESSGMSLAELCEEALALQGHDSEQREQVRRSERGRVTGGVLSAVTSRAAIVFDRVCSIEQPESPCRARAIALNSARPIPDDSAYRAAALARCAGGGRAPFTRSPSAGGGRAPDCSLTPSAGGARTMRSRSTRSAITPRRSAASRWARGTRRSCGRASTSGPTPSLCARASRRGPRARCPRCPGASRAART